MKNTAILVKTSFCRTGRRNLIRVGKSVTAKNRQQFPLHLYSRSLSFRKKVADVSSKSVCAFDLFIDELDGEIWLVWENQYRQNTVRCFLYICICVCSTHISYIVYSYTLLPAWCASVLAQILYNRPEGVPPTRRIKLARFCLSCCLRWLSNRASYFLNLGDRYMLSHKRRVAVVELFLYESA